MRFKININIPQLNTTFVQSETYVFINLCVKFKVNVDDLQIIILKQLLLLLFIIIWDSSHTQYTQVYRV